jgi:hypothetical protein
MEQSKNSTATKDIGFVTGETPHWRTQGAGENQKQSFESWMLAL